MSELIVIAAETRDAAFVLRDEIARMARDFTVEKEDVVVITRDTGGEVELHTQTNTVATQAIGGTLWGLGLGAIFLMPLVGAAVGAAAGALTGRTLNIRVDDNFLKGIGRELPPGTAAVALLAREVDPERLAALVAAHGGEVLHAALSHDVARAMPEEVDAETPTKDEAHIAGYKDQSAL